MRKWLKAKDLSLVPETWGYYALYGSEKLTEDLRADMRGSGAAKNMRQSLAELSKRTPQMTDPIYAYLPDSAEKEAETWLGGPL